MELLGGYLNHDRDADYLVRLMASPSVTRPERVPLGRAIRLSDAQISKLVEDYAAGATVYTLATRFGINRNTVSFHLERRGVRRRYNLLSPRQVERSAELYCQGWSLERLGEHFGVTANTVRAGLRKVDVTMRRVGTNQWLH